MQRVYLSSYFVSFRNISQKCSYQGPQKILLYFWGKGAHKQKSEHCRPRQCDFKSAVCAVSSPVNVTFCPSTSSAQINLRELPSYASFLTNRLSQAAVGCLMLAYSFSPRVHSIPRGPLYNALTASEERSKRLHLRKSSVAGIANDCAICRTNA